MAQGRTEMLLRPCARPSGRPFESAETFLESAETRLYVSPEFRGLCCNSAKVSYCSSVPEQGQGAEGGRSLEVSLSVGRSVGCLHGVQAWSFVQRQNSIATGTGAERLRERTRRASEDEGQKALRQEPSIVEKTAKRFRQEGKFETGKRE